MKRAAEELNIKYSTAKTILQTFRSEHRIAKKPKRSLMTKRIIKHEQRLIRVLNNSRALKIMRRIIATETCKKKLYRKLTDKGVREISTAAALPKDHANFTNKKSFPRIVSATQMMIFPLVENGPGTHQITRSVITESEYLLRKKDIFQIIIKESLDEKYKRIVDYSNLLLPRDKSRLGILEPQPRKLPPINDLLTNSLVVRIEAAFCFSDYGAEIVNSYNNR